MQQASPIPELQWECGMIGKATHTLPAHLQADPIMPLILKKGLGGEWLLMEGYENDSGVSNNSSTDPPFSSRDARSI